MLKSAASLGVSEAREALEMDREVDIKMEDKEMEAQKLYERALDWEEEGEEQDRVFALQLYRKAAELGHSDGLRR